MTVLFQTAEIAVATPGARSPHMQPIFWTLGNKLKDEKMPESHRGSERPKSACESDLEHSITTVLDDLDRQLDYIFVLI